MRRLLIAGNWKMYKTPPETRAFFEAFRPLVADVSDCDIAICPPFPCIEAAVEGAWESGIGIGGQNLCPGKEGAMTGEVSGYMLSALGCRYVVIGHSERRQFFGETDGGVKAKTGAAFEWDLTPIVCVGERLEEREADRTEEVLEAQFEGGLAGLDPQDFARVVIAYEPVWAIGTGRTATPQMAADAHRFLRSLVQKRYGLEQSVETRILYGGSVKPENAHTLMAEEEIDGALVGGASLEPASFAKIVKR